MKHGPAAYNHHFTLVALVAAIGGAFDDGQCLAGDAPCAAPPAGLVASCVRQERCSARVCAGPRFFCIIFWAPGRFSDEVGP